MVKVSHFRKFFLDLHSLKENDTYYTETYHAISRQHFRFAAAEYSEVSLDTIKQKGNYLSRLLLVS